MTADTLRDLAAPSALHPVLGIPLAGIAIICGGRALRDQQWAFDRLDEIDGAEQIEFVVEGGQRSYERGRMVGGADFFACRWANMRGRGIATVEAEWRVYGRRAGPMRNGRMLREFMPARVIALPGGSGTADMIRQAKRARVRVIEVTA